MNIETFIKLLDTYNLPWLILAIITWLTIYFSCSLQQFFHALPVGFWTMVIGGMLESFFIEHKFWVDRFIMIHIGELDLFVLIGPFFAVGLVLIRFLPKGRWKKHLIVLTFAALSTAIELIAIKLKFLEYHPEKWGVLYSFVAYSLALMSALGFYYVYYSKDTYKYP
ncbi:hypothetical protein [Clostridium formicaceticum]|uniref:Uncharacterized protein n=1 Tax=Clostridium formicaceticum TaxID=1497 RepID=A0AAC9RNR8_9CLOT|nr:hypothetical protein [Clostridium formicaceticum]AOY77109.1 hypothetical protein BJL90_15385 [Clostridium formicaceticum]ARE87620.1 hypothetical protein CLFO_20200 [Clostridium formicaceticum]